jgi:hypothetical protein
MRYSMEKDQRSYPEHGCGSSNNGLKVPAEDAENELIEMVRRGFALV